MTAAATTHVPVAATEVPTPSGRRLAGALLAAGGAATVAGFSTAALASSLSPGWAADPNRLAPLVIAVVYAAIIVAILLVLGRTQMLRRHLLAWRPATQRSLALGVTTWASAYLVAAVLYAISAPVTGTTLHDVGALLLSVGADNGRLGDASQPVAAVMLLRILILSPLAEEILFRGALYTWLRTKISAEWTILLTALAFGLVHQSPSFLPLAVLVGLAAGWIREKTDSVVVPIAVHAIQSAVIVVLSLALTGWDTPALLH